MVQMRAAIVIWSYVMCEYLIYGVHAVVWCVMSGMHYVWYHDM